MSEYDPALDGFTITKRALDKFAEVRDDDPQPERLMLRVAVAGVERGDYAYDMYFQLREAVTPADAVLDYGDLAVVVPHESLEKLRGAVIDFVEADGESWVIDNPNHPRPTIGTQLPIMVLDRQINPSIAAHGGHAELVGVEEGTAYLRLGGGCQGCSMATVTLGQGIEVAIKELVPEITRVLDVTDHASGTNPYFEAAKK